MTVMLVSTVPGQAGAEDQKDPSEVITVEEAYKLGMEYRDKNSSEWELKSRRDLILDRDDVYVKSWQEIAENLYAYVEGRCNKVGNVDFSKFSDPGKIFGFLVSLTDGTDNTAAFPRIIPFTNEGYFVIQRRIGNAISTVMAESEFSNEFVAVLLTSDLEGIATDTENFPFRYAISLFGGAWDSRKSWRVAASVDTTSGPADVDIPIYNEQIMTAMNACFAQAGH